MRRATGLLSLLPLALLVAACVLLTARPDTAGEILTSTAVVHTASVTATSATPTAKPCEAEEPECAGQAAFREAVSGMLVQRAHILSAWKRYVAYLKSDSTSWDAGIRILEDIWEHCEEHEERAAEIVPPPAAREAMEKYRASIDEFMTGIAHHHEYYRKDDDVYRGAGDFFMERSDRLYRQFEQAMSDFEKLCPETRQP